jgi:hypothetical protein
MIAMTAMGNRSDGRGFGGAEAPPPFPKRHEIIERFPKVPEQTIAPEAEAKTLSSREQQGLPRTIEDPATLDRLAVILRPALTARVQRS